MGLSRTLQNNFAKVEKTILVGTNAGFDIDSDSASVAKEDGTKHTIDAVEKQIYDLLVAKHWGMKYATNAAATILRVDQIIMAKRAGGPKPRGGDGPMDDGDDY